MKCGPVLVMALIVLRLSPADENVCPYIKTRNISSLVLLSSLKAKMKFDADCWKEIKFLNVDNGSISCAVFHFRTVCVRSIKFPTIPLPPQQGNGCETVGRRSMEVRVFLSSFSFLIAQKHLIFRT